MVYFYLWKKFISHVSSKKKRGPFNDELESVNAANGAMNKNEENESKTTTVHATGFRRFSRWLRVPFYPFLISIYAPFWLASNNYDLFPFSDAVRSLIVSLTAVGIGILVLGIIYRNRHKAALVASIGFLCLYSFAPLRYLLSIAGTKSPGQTALILAVAFFLVSVIAAYFWRSAGVSLTRILNGFAVFLLLSPVATLAGNELNSGIQRNTANSHSIDTRAQADAAPSVVHVVLDAYSRSDALNALYGFDNSHFVESLRELGFSVSENATTAYNQTILSMSSVFSMGYINEKLASLSKTKKSEKEIRVALHWAFQSSPVLQRLRAMGYKIANVDNFYWGTNFENPDYVVSDTQATFGFSHFETTLLQYTPIYKLLGEFSALDRKYAKVKFALGPHQLDEIERPFFLYNHILAPHAPFNISQDGAFRDSDSKLARSDDNDPKSPEDYRFYRDGYIAKLRYVNGQIIKMARNLIHDIPDPKIIIIHGDHGGGLYYDPTRKAGTCLRERYGTLFAIYASRGLPSLEISDGFNIVNTYRHVFTKIFGSGDQPLPSRHFFATWQNPEKMIAVEEDELRDFGSSCRPQTANSAVGATAAYMTEPTMGN